MEYLYFECQYQKGFYEDRKNYLTKFHEYYLKYYTLMIRSLKFQNYWFHYCTSFEFIFK